MSCGKGFFEPVNLRFINNSLQSFCVILIPHSFPAVTLNTVRHQRIYYYYNYDCMAKMYTYIAYIFFCEAIHITISSLLAPTTHPDTHHCTKVASISSLICWFQPEQLINVKCDVELSGLQFYLYDK